MTDLKAFNRFMNMRFFAFLFVELIAYHLQYAGKLDAAVWGWVAVAGISAFFGIEFGKEFLNRGSVPDITKESP